MSLDNPPAFPVGFTTDEHRTSQGMTLRDYFAGQLLPEVYRASIDLGAEDQAAIAAECYELADELLKRRAQ